MAGELGHDVIIGHHDAVMADLEPGTQRGLLAGCLLDDTDLVDAVAVFVEQRDGLLRGDLVGGGKQRDEE